MLRIRCSRFGKKKEPSYRVFLIDSRRPRDSITKEILGFYNPFMRGKGEWIRLNIDRINHWLSLGAKSSFLVNRLVLKYQN